MERMVTRRRYLTAAFGLSTAVAVAGCSGGDSSPATSTPEPSLSVAEFVFCADQPAGYDDYTEQADQTYTLDETIWVYLDVRDLGSESAGEDTIVIDLTESLEVVGPNGSSILSDEIQFDNEFAADIDLQTFFIANDIHLTGDAPTGDYEVQVSLSDGITGQSTEATGTFTIEG